MSIREPDRRDDFCRPFPRPRPFSGAGHWPGSRSGTRREELLLKPDVLQKVWVLRKLLYDMDEIEAMEFLLDKIRSTKSNNEFFDMMRKGG